MPLQTTSITTTKTSLWPINSPATASGGDQPIIVPPNPAMDLLAQRIINNPNLNLKYENTKIIDFFGELAKDTSTAINLITRVDKCQSANNWSDTTTYYNFSLVLQETAFFDPDYENSSRPKSRKLG